MFHLRQWINWRLVERGVDKPNKVPYDPLTGADIDPHNPAAWQSYEAAAARGSVGIVITDTDPLFCIDLDGALQADGSWSPLALDVCGRFPGAYMEVSQSGRGLHIIGCARTGDHKTKRHGLPGVELYTRGRFIAVTRAGERGDAWMDHSAALAAFIRDYGLERDEADAGAAWTNGPCEGATPPADDDALLDRMLHSASAASVFGARCSPRDLWNADPVKLAAAYPDPAGGFDHSAADAALMQHLAFWTGKDCERMDRLFRRSMLMRPKYADRSDYRRRTILGAVSLCVNVYTAGADQRRADQLADARAIGASADDLALPAIMTLPEMLEGLAYVASSKEVAHRTTGRVRSWEAAIGDFAGSRHRYTDDAGKERNVSALLAWRAHPERITVDVIAWRPGSDEFCEPPEAIGGNTRAYNLWRGFRPMPAPENWSEWSAVFLKHLEYLIPDMTQRARFIDWLAHILQAPGTLPHTCYVMIAKETGIGRNWLGSLLARVFRGHVAVGVSLPPLLDGGFNGRLSQKLLATVDETREGMSMNRHARGEALKRLITEESRLIDTKYGRQVVEQNCCRWLMFSNHDDAVPIDNNDRRVIVIENPSRRQSADYYSYIYSMLTRPELAGSVRQFLASRDISKFNPGAHADMSDAKRRSIQAMESGIDQAVRAFKDIWPSAVAGRSDVRNFVAQDIGAIPNEAALGHAMDRAGISQSRRRIRIGILLDRPVGIGTSSQELEKYDAPTLAAEISRARAAPK